MAGLSQGDGGSHLGQIWHQVVGDAVGVLPDEARGVRANGVEIPQQLHRPVLPWRRRGPSQMETTPHSSSISEYIQKNIRAVQKIKHSVCHNVFVREFTNLKPCLKNAMLRGNHVELWKKEHTVWGCMNIAQNLLNHKLRSVKEVIHWITNTCEPPKMCSGGTNKPTSNIFVSFIFSFCSYGFRLYFTMTFCVVGMRRKETQHKQKNS